MFIDDDALDFVPPDRQAILEPELGDIMARAQGILRLAGFLAADLQAASVRKPDPLRHMVEHDHAAKGCGQSGDQQTMISPGDDPGNGPGRVTAKPIGCQPFLTQETPRVLSASLSQIDSPD